jgi:hypothetical protein
MTEAEMRDATAAADAAPKTDAAPDPAKPGKSGRFQFGGSK